MKWRKLGRVFIPDGSKWWARQRAYLPTPMILEEQGIIRVFYSSMDEDFVGRIGFVDLDIQNPLAIIHESLEPVLSTGRYGTFDAHGVSPCCFLSWREYLILLYIGWQRIPNWHPLNFVGAAVRDGDIFRRHQMVPILDRTPQESFGRSACSILNDDGLLKIWYVQFDGWIVVGGKPYPKYGIRYAESLSAFEWPPFGLSVLEPRDEEFGLGRPWIIKDDDLYRMWYSIRSETAPYRIGYAESKDGFAWERKDDEVGIGLSRDGWDSEMICFAAVVDVPTDRLMFYNGNRHGQTGFGVAILERD